MVGQTWAIFDNTSVQLLGFEMAGARLLDVFNAAFATYNLATPIDVTGLPFAPSAPPNPLGWDTTAGPFIITGGVDRSGTFTAVIPTPIPGALPLFATGLGALGLLGWRRKRKNAAIAVA